ncbi:MAG: hypothetical protein QOG43_2901 [Actinomycetota bacterium]|jgi:hypothetical protein|nr:hypothetical protein [Actinomycetota bacterium]
MAHDLQVLDFLGQLADTLSSTPDDGRGGMLFHVAPADDGLTVGMLDLEGQAPAEFLLGTVAPDAWIALGLAAHGWARSLDDSGDPRDRRRTSSAVIVHRSGQVVSRLRVGDEVIHEPPAYGLTLDGLQRALGLPTAPPLVTTGELFARLWLENVVVAAEARAGSITWAEARALHPAVQLLADEEPVEGGDDPVAAGKAMARVFDWENLRWQAVEGLWQAACLTPTDAAWCDAGAFSRWVMDRRPGIDRLLADVRRTAGSGVARRCTSVLHHLGVLRRSAA